MAHLPRTLLPLALAALVTACATGPSRSDAENHALYAAHAGAPVNQFRYFGSLNSWQDLGDDALVVWTRPSEAWLLELSGPCPDLEYAHSISVSHTFNTVSARLDSVTVHGAGMMQIPCRIERIRPIDVTALRAAEREAREAPQASGT